MSGGNVWKWWVWTEKGCEIGKYAWMSRWPLWGTRALFHCRSSDRPCGTHLRVIPLRGEEAAGGFIYQLLALIHRDHSKDLNSLAVLAFSGNEPYFLGWGNNSGREMQEAFGLEGDRLLVINPLDGSRECEQGASSISCNNHESCNHRETIREK